MRAWLYCALICAALLASAPAARANTTRSSNWAGYAVHRARVSFRKVSGTWTAPNPACVPGDPTFSAEWVGLGGYSETSDALEQIGTEADCSPSGQAEMSAWYELVPAPSRTIGLVVHPGDRMHAAVTVIGDRVTVVLQDLTRHRSFTRTLDAGSIDVSSAEWIVEAPSDCVSRYSCQTLPLADFGSTGFGSAKAVSTGGRSGSITSPGWGWTKIDLTTSGPHFAVYRTPGPAAGVATPSALRAGGTAFEVTYAQAAAPVAPYLSRRRVTLRTGYIVHPGRSPRPFLSSSYRAPTRF